MSGLHPKIAKLIQEDEEATRAFDAKRAEERIKSDEKRKKFASLPLLPATPSQYIEWLRGFLDNGGVPTHSYDYLIPSHITIATSDFELDSGMCGAMSSNIIVPVGIKCVGGARGHCNLYYMDGFVCDGGFVPIYTNTRF